MSAGAALRTTAEERLRAGRAQPAPGAARALRVVSILGLLRWLVVEGGFLLCATVATGAR